MAPQKSLLLFITTNGRMPLFIGFENEAQKDIDFLTPAEAFILLKQCISNFFKVIEIVLQ